MIAIFDHGNEGVSCVAYEVSGDIGLKMVFLHGEEVS